MSDEDTYGAVRRHVAEFWPDNAEEEFVWTLGPVGQTLPRFRVRRIAPRDKDEPWVYVTVGVWEASSSEEDRTEFVLLSPVETPRHVETLAMVANFHADQRYRLRVGSTVQIGRSWLDGAVADHLLVSLPYPFGPALEWCDTPSGMVRFLWLVPITSEEASYARQRGIEALEQLLERSGANVIAASRQSLV